MTITELKQLIKETIEEMNINESFPPGFSSTDVESIPAFLKAEEPMEEAVEDLGADVKDLPPEELQAYMQRIASREKTDVGAESDKYKYPYIHRSNIVDENGKVIDPDKLKSMIMQRPTNIIKQNTKMKKSGFEGINFYDLSLPALRGLIVDEATGQFKIVNTCPGAGACRVYCYAKKGGYVQWKSSSLSQTRVLNFLLNDWEGFKAKLLSELSAITKTAGKKVMGKKYNAILRWHDSGDFISEKYLQIAFDIAKLTPNILHYA